LLTFSLILKSYVTSAQEILWWFDLKDSAFGQACASDIDSDGTNEIVFGCYRNDSCVYALNSENGTLLWKYNTSTGNAEGCNDVAPIIYDVDGDGRKEVIVPSSCTPKTFCFDGESGTVKWTAPTRGSDSPPTIGDIDGDHKLEVLHGEFLGYVICLEAESGKRKWELLVQPNSWIQTAPTLVDLDGDGLLDFVVSTWALSKDDTNRIYAFRGYDQKLLWSKKINGTVYHGTSVADLDSDGSPELVFGDYSGTLYVLNAATGETLWTYSDNSLYYIGSPVCIADLDGDNSCELVFSSLYDVIALKSDGNLFWRFSLHSGSPSFRGVALSDLDNDNLVDVVFGTSDGRVIVLKGNTGNELTSIDLQRHIGKEFEIEHCPLIADFNGDGVKEIFVVGGKTSYPNFRENYGRAYMVSYGAGVGSDWLMFQSNIHRTSSLCENLSKVFEKHNENKAYDVRYINSVNKIKIYVNNTDIGPGQILVFDVMGRKVFASNVVNNLDCESKEIEIDAKDLPTGLYFVILTTNNIHFAKSIFILK